MEHPKQPEQKPDPTLSAGPQGPARLHVNATGELSGTWIICGLGNHAPAEAVFGRPLSRSRHNVGAQLVEQWARLNGHHWIAGHGARWSAAPGAQFTFCLPCASNLNGSGQDLLLDARPDPAGRPIVAVIDDLDLPVGALRFRARGSSGGHRGLADLQQHWGEVPRLRVGIGRPAPGQSVLDHVLGDHVLPPDLADQAWAVLSRGLSEIDRTR